MVVILSLLSSRWSLERMTTEAMIAERRVAERANMEFRESEVAVE